MARFQSPKGKKEKSAERRNRKQANRTAQSQARWVLIGFFVVLVVIFVLVYIASQRPATIPDANKDELVKIFRESFEKAAKDAEKQKEEGGGEI